MSNEGQEEFRGKVPCELPGRAGPPGFAEPEAAFDGPGFSPRIHALEIAFEASRAQFAMIQERLVAMDEARGLARSELRAAIDLLAGRVGEITRHMDEDRGRREAEEAARIREQRKTDVWGAWARTLLPLGAALAGAGAMAFLDGRIGGAL